MYRKILFLVILGAFLGGCVATKLPSNLQNPQNFQIEKFTGLWYEIGKMQSPFQSTLNNTTYEYGLNSEFVPGTGITKNFNSSYIMDSFMVYDTGGNAVKVSSANIMTDDIGPEVESITYENGNYTIRVSDSQSGIWKITNSTGDVIYERYDGITS